MFKYIYMGKGYNYYWQAPVVACIATHGIRLWYMILCMSTHKICMKSSQLDSHRHVLAQLVECWADNKVVRGNLCGTWKNML